MQKKMHYACPVDTWYSDGHTLKILPFVRCVRKGSQKKFMSSNVDCADFKV